MGTPPNQIRVSRLAARRFLLHAFALQQWQPLPDVEAALRQLEFVQMDSINVCGRMHDLILWPRVTNYTPLHLHDALYRPPRTAFEYNFPNLSALPLADYPYFVRAMRERATIPGRWRGLTDDEHPISERLLAAMAADGPLRSRSTGSADGHALSGWGTRTTVAALVLDKLWLHGTISIAHRENFERWFDRTERLLPDAWHWHADDSALPTAEEQQIYLARKRLRARRLFRPRRDERETLGESALVSVEVEGVAKPWYVLAEDAEWLANGEQLPVSPELTLLAPLDPLVYDRVRTRELWDFDYTWEVYTPQAKRQWGYYALPLLHGDALVGRVDPKIDRHTSAKKKAATGEPGALHVHALHWEPDVDRVALRPLLEARLHQFALVQGACWGGALP